MQIVIHGSVITIIQTPLQCLYQVFVLNEVTVIVFRQYQLMIC